MMSEFELIRRYFTRPAHHADLAVGDDAALVTVAADAQLVIATDMLVAGRHFFSDVDARALGHKSLAVNLSDMAAMGATPRWFTLALALPSVEEPWLANFAAGLFALAERHEVDLIGGDTTAGPLNICVQILGEVPRGQALTRAGARPGDDIWVSGTLGDAALAVRALEHRVALAPATLEHLRMKLDWPTPRVELGQALRGIAHSAIDISDGLLADLGHILDRSAVGAHLHWESVPRSAPLRALADMDLQRQCVLAGGDDYELCFTAAVGARARIDALSQAVGIALHRVGGITAQPGLQVLDAAGANLPIDKRGHDHFA